MEKEREYSVDKNRMTWSARSLQIRPKGSLLFKPTCVSWLLEAKPKICLKPPDGSIVTELDQWADDKGYYC